MGLVLFPPPNNERAFSIDDVDFLFLKFDDVCCSWAIVEVLEELLQGIFRALSLPLNLASSAPKTAVCKPPNVHSPCYLVCSRRIPSGHSSGLWIG